MAVLLTGYNWDYDYSQGIVTALTAAVAVIMAVALIVMMTKAVTHSFLMGVTTVQGVVCVK